MHFWINNRSSSGFGQYQRPGMASFGYNPRRNRNKTTNQSAPPHTSSSSSGSTSTARQHVASSTNHHGKTTTHHHHHHHHHRGARNNQRTVDGEVVGIHDIIIEDSTPPHDLNSHDVPIVTYPNDDTTTIHPTSTRTNGVNQWLPIQIICGLCMILAITLVLLKLYFESYMTGFQVLSLILMSFVLLILTILLSLLRSRRKRSQNTSQLQPTMNIHSQSVIVQVTQTCEPPPPYALALTLPEKQSEIKISTPPPSYEKINII